MIEKLSHIENDQDNNYVEDPFIPNLHYHHRNANDTSLDCCKLIKGNPQCPTIGT